MVQICETSKNIVFRLQFYHSLYQTKLRASDDHRRSLWFQGKTVLLLGGLLLVLSLISHHSDPTALPGHNRQRHCPSLNRKASAERPLVEGLQVLLGAVRSLCYQASPKLSTTGSVVRGPDPPFYVFALREAKKSYQKKCFPKETVSKNKTCKPHTPNSH